MYNIYQKIALWFFVLALIVIGVAGYLYGKEHNSPAYRKLNELTDTMSFWNNNQTTTDEIISNLPTTQTALTNEHATTFTWKYQGEEYVLKLDLSKELFEQYQNSPKNYTYSGSLPANWLE